MKTRDWFSFNHEAADARRKAAEEMRQRAAERKEERIKQTEQRKQERAAQKPLSETRFACRSCQKVWFLDNVKQIERDNKMANISNLGRSMTPAARVLTKKKQTVDLNHCPDCGSNNITRTNVVAGVPTTPIEPEPTSPASTATAEQTYISDELLKLATLRDQGILTEQEFQMQKAKLLGSQTANQTQQRRFDPQTGERL